MNKKDILWQHAVEEEKSRLICLPAEELRAMEFYSSHTVQIGKTQIEVGIWHEEPSIRTHSEVHLFVLMAERHFLPFISVYRKYLAGFALDNNGVVVPIPEDILASYD